MARAMSTKMMNKQQNQTSAQVHRLFTTLLRKFEKLTPPAFDELLKDGTIHLCVEYLFMDSLAIEVLRQFSFEREAMVSIFYIQGFQSALVPMVQHNDLGALFLLWAMSDKEELTSPLCHVPGFLQAILIASNGPPQSDSAIYSLSVLRNLTMFIECRDQVLEQLDRTELLQILTSRTKLGSKREAIKATMAIANLVGKDEDQNTGSLLATTPTMLLSIVDIVKHILNSDFGDNEGENFHLYEPLLSLKYLSIPQKNREILIPALKELLPVILEQAMREELCRAEAVGYTLEICSQFAFEEPCLDYFCRETQLQLLVEKIVMNEDGEGEFALVIREAEGLLWTLRGGEKQQPSSSLSLSLPQFNQDEDDAEEEGSTSAVAPSKKIMISYSWAQKDVALKVAANFKMQGLQVWQDVQDMKQNIMESMAQGVLESYAVVILLSKNYKESANCQREANYAAKRGKKIIPLVVVDGYTGDGWLELFIAPLLYYDVTRTFDSTLKQMITNELQHDVVPRASVVGGAGREVLGVEQVVEHVTNKHPELAYLGSKLTENGMDGKTVRELVRALGAGQVKMDEIKQWFGVKTVADLFKLKLAFEDLA
ncbi:hypothetical protein BASA81_004806 [Batrachochytrium salamandrivorans]|nr:hypothetical protein BASA81_004806 [Batrachochytrium salamandrivorans]